MLYWKNSKNEYISVDVNFFDLSKMKNSFVFVKVGDNKFQPTQNDIDLITKTFNNYFKDRQLEFSGLIGHDKINIEILDKAQFFDKIVVVKVGDPDTWKPTEAYMRTIKKEIDLAFSSAGIRDVVVLDVLADIGTE